MFGALLVILAVAIVYLHRVVGRDVEEKVSPRWLNENAYRDGRHHR